MESPASFLEAGLELLQCEPLTASPGSGRKNCSGSPGACQECCKLRVKTTDFVLGHGGINRHGERRKRPLLSARLHRFTLVWTGTVQVLLLFSMCSPLPITLAIHFTLPPFLPAAPPHTPPAGRCGRMPPALPLPAGPADASTTAARTGPARQRAGLVRAALPFGRRVSRALAGAPLG